MSLSSPELQEPDCAWDEVAPEPEADDSPAASVRGAAVRGAAWTVLGFGGKFGLRFGFNLLLTRLVAPRVFGVMALVYLLVHSLHMFSDMGLQQCVVHHRRGEDDDFLHTAWTLQAIRGFILWLLTTALAVPAAAFYGEPALRWLIPLCGTTALLDGLYSTSLLTLNRRLARGRLVFLDIGAYLATMSGVVLAVWYFGRQGGLTDPAVQYRQMYSFVAGSIATCIIYIFVSHRVLPGSRPRFYFDSSAARDLFHFGGWVFVSTACNFLAANADRLVIGKLSLDILGVYQLGSQLASLPAQLLAALCSQLVFPLYSRLVNDGGDARPAMARAHRLLGLLAGTLTAGLIAAGPTLVECLYPGRYHDAGRYVQLLACAAWFTMLQSSGEAVLLARGQTRLLAIGQVVRLLALPGLIYVGYTLDGLTGLVIGFAAAEALRYGLIATSVARLGLPFYRIDLAVGSMVGSSVGLILWVGPHLWGDWPAWGRLACESAVVLTFWTIVFGMQWRREHRR